MIYFSDNMRKLKVKLDCVFEIMLIVLSKLFPFSSNVVFAVASPLLVNYVKLGACTGNTNYFCCLPLVIKGKRRKKRRSETLKKI